MADHAEAPKSPSASSEEAIDADVFRADVRRLNNVLPDQQEIVDAAPEMPAREALLLMEKHGFSQLPVRLGEEVIGVFTYRSFARGVAKSKDERDVASLPVSEFVEQLRYVRTSDPFDELLDELEARDAVLVGDPERLLGIATPMDILRYLYEVAHAYVLLQEIELALRELIRLSATPEQLDECARRALAGAYPAEDNIPRVLEAMTFSDYVSILARGDSWGLFEQAFGARRDRVRSRLKEVRDLRNDAFHFRRTLTVEDHDQLRGSRDWLFLRLRLSKPDPVRSVTRQAMQP